MLEGLIGARMEGRGAVIPARSRHLRAPTTGNTMPMSAVIPARSRHLRGLPSRQSRFPVFYLPGTTLAPGSKKEEFRTKNEKRCTGTEKKHMRGFWAFVESLPFHVSLLQPAGKRSFVQRSGKGTARKAEPDNRVLSGTGRWSQDWGSRCCSYRNGPRHSLTRLQAAVLSWAEATLYISKQVQVRRASLGSHGISSELSHA